MKLCLNMKSNYHFFLVKNYLVSQYVLSYICLLCSLMKVVIPKIWRNINCKWTKIFLRNSFLFSSIYLLNICRRSGYWGSVLKTQYFLTQFNEPNIAFCAVWPTLYQGSRTNIFPNRYQDGSTGQHWKNFTSTSKQQIEEKLFWRL